MALNFFGNTLLKNYTVSESYLVITPESVTIVLHIHVLSSETQHGQTYCLTTILQF